MGRREASMPARPTGGEKKLARCRRQQGGEPGGARAGWGRGDQQAVPVRGWRRRGDNDLVQRARDSDERDCCAEGKTGEKGTMRQRRQTRKQRDDQSSEIGVQLEMMSANVKDWPGEL
mmetsp:Transcript_11435/g.23204  ORF Transcript_11435/g.23204 Transcript_11435/m.23204 type:complete len:118 (-) Transcript_11435:1628-1981(-)